MRPFKVITYMDMSYAHTGFDMSYTKFHDSSSSPFDHMFGVEGSCLPKPKTLGPPIFVFSRCSCISNARPLNKISFSEPYFLILSRVV